MTSPDPGIDERARRDREAVEARLAALVERLAPEHAGMREAIEYSLLGGGKRLRPLLCLWTHDALGGNRREAALDAACAVECVHTYSLVHDDLPCMDDDDLRRGKASSHRRFNEATAVLAGDALLTLGFQIVGSLPDRPDVAPDDAVAVLQVLAGASGTGGLITGQALDLSSRAGASLEDVNRIHEFKTGRLLAAAMELGALLAGASATVRARVRRCGLLAGSAFQITDDVLDRVGSKELLGKTPGKDVDGGKATFPAAVGVDEARKTARRRVDEALAELPELRDTPLAALIESIAARTA